MRYDRWIYHFIIGIAGIVISGFVGWYFNNFWSSLFAFLGIIISYSYLYFKTVIIG